MHALSSTLVSLSLYSVRIHPYTIHSLSSPFCPFYCYIVYSSHHKWPTSSTSHVYIHFYHTLSIKPHHVHLPVSISNSFATYISPSHSDPHTQTSSTLNPIIPSLWCPSASFLHTSQTSLPVIPFIMSLLAAQDCRPENCVAEHHV